MFNFAIFGTDCRDSYFSPRTLVLSELLLCVGPIETEDFERTFLRIMGVVAFVQ